MSKALTILTASALVLALQASLALPQQQQPQPRPYYVGNEGVGLPVAPPAPGAPSAPFAPASDNVRMFGALYSAESCTYDAERGVIVAPSRGVPQSVRANDAWISFINHDGSVHTPRWIGIQPAGADRDTMTPPLVLNEPLGSAIHNGALYLADREGGTTDAAGQVSPSVAVVRSFDLRTGAPLRALRVPGSTGLNDIAIAADGTIYGTNTGAMGANADPNTWAVWKISPAGEPSLFKQGAPLARPNGIEIDTDGNIVVVNMNTADVITFAPDGRVVRTEQAAQAGPPPPLITEIQKALQFTNAGTASFMPATGLFPPCPFTAAL